MYGLAASFLAYSFLLLYVQFWGPEMAGINTRYHGGKMVLTEVLPGGVSDRAGLKIGDHIVSIDGQPVHNLLDWIGVRTNFAVGKKYRVQLLRGGEALELELEFGSRPSLAQRWRMDNSAVYMGLSLQFTRMLLLALAFVIAFSRPHDLVARVGAALLAGLSIGDPAPPYSLFAVWRELPFPVSALLWAALLTSMMAAPLLFAFFAIFPRRIIQSRRIWALSALPIAISLPGMIYVYYCMVYRPQQATGLLPPWMMGGALAWATVYVLAGFGLLIYNYFTLEDLNHRRRLRVLVWGSMIGLLPSLFAFPLLYSPTLQDAAGETMTNVIGYMAIFLIPIFPLSFTYAILRHQMFDIRVIIRNGLQYAAARGALLYMIPGVIAVLVLDLLLHRDQTLGTLLAQRGWQYGALIGLAYFAHSKRQSWMEALDRRFYRERYNAQQLLRETVDEIRTASSMEDIAPRVVARMEAALHPEFAALMLYRAGSGSYHAVAIAPPTMHLPEVSAHSKLMTVFRALGKPLMVSLNESSWLKQQLPHNETEFLRASNIHLLVPISTFDQNADIEALLALGGKRSEEPYSNEDQELLAAIAGALALLPGLQSSRQSPNLVNPAAQAAPMAFATPGAEECPRCSCCFEPGTARCPQDGELLKQTSTPRKLASRYHLEKTLGQGGMGKVYKALDTALERVVAVKVIRDDLIRDTEMAERFRREARSAAALTHSNLVAVHDFGLDGERRAFLVMEYLEGNSLRGALRAKGRFEPLRALTILRAVSSAMQAAHQRQLVHRDLKPENIFLVSHGSGEMAKVLDFGIAKFLPQASHENADTLTHADSGLTTPGLLVGTPFYMSPEQLRGGAVQASWDIWALSIIAYEMLTGAYPFNEKSVHECHRSILAGEVMPVSRKVAGAPAEWQSFFETAFHADCTRRPQSMAAWMDEAERCIRHPATE